MIIYKEFFPYLYALLSVTSTLLNVKFADDASRATHTSSEPRLTGLFLTAVSHSNVNVVPWLVEVHGTTSLLPSTCTICGEAVMLGGASSVSEVGH